MEKEIRKKETEDFEETDFRFRCYTKGELASLYLPEIRRDSAVRTLIRWIDRNQTLGSRLAALGYRRSNRILTVEQVREIAAVLGRP